MLTEVEIEGARMPAPAAAQTASAADLEIRPQNRLFSMIDLFAGCGGLSLGFEQAGFTPVFVSELNEDALNTYLANRHHSLGGEKFADNKSLRCNDAHDLDDRGLARLSTETFYRPKSNSRDKFWV
jgi:DNA (cytosine-5)-methyltransferase 1